MSVKVCLIGGYPKGEPLIPFSAMTLSGIRLRKIVAEVGVIDAKYFDLWETAEEERKGIIDMEVRSYLHCLSAEGYQMVALGKHVDRCLKGAGFTFIALPHPAARRKSDLAKLKTGLFEIGGLDYAGQRDRFLVTALEKLETNEVVLERLKKAGFEQVGYFRELLDAARQVMQQIQGVRGLNPRTVAAGSLYIASLGICWAFTQKQAGETLEMAEYTIRDFCCWVQNEMKLVVE